MLKLHLINMYNRLNNISEVNMEIIALLTCLLIIVHIFCPMFIGLLTTKDVSIDYLFSSRDEELNINLFRKIKKSIY